VIKPLSKTAFSEKSLFKLPKLLVQQIICLMDQTDQSVGGCFRRDSELEDYTLVQARLHADSYTNRGNRL